jgi:hypothetical protein
MIINQLFSIFIRLTEDIITTNTGKIATTPTFQ